MSKSERDIVSSNYSPDLIPNMLGEFGGLGIKFVIYRTSPNSGVDAAQWIKLNYGLERYKKVGIPTEIRNAWDVKTGDRLGGHEIILTTGSIVDLAQKDKYPWIQSFRDTILRQVVESHIPIIAPCYGLAELAALYANKGQDSFPKGIRELGRADIIQTGGNPIFYGLTNFTGYVHHNGSIPSELIDARHELTVHGVTKVDGKIVPALVAFGDNMVIGTSFHREILNAETLELFTRAVKREVARVVDSPKFLINEEKLKKLNLIPEGLKPEGVKEYLLEKSLDGYSVELLQTVSEIVGDGRPRNLGWMRGYLDGTTYLGDEGYKPNASLVFIDNLVRMYAHRIRGISAPEIGIGELIDVISEKQRKPLYAFVSKGEYYFAEIMGATDVEAREMYDMYIHGFGDHVPMTLEEHKKMSQLGDTIAIRDGNGKLVALRAMVYNRQDSVPDDKHVQEYHAYQNHTVVHRDFRGKGLISELTRIALSLASEKSKTAIITSVNPINPANLIPLTRLGYKIIAYSPDHFGVGEHRYMLELDLKQQKEPVCDDVLITRIERNKIQKFTGEGNATSYYIDASDTTAAERLLELGFVGSRVINVNDSGKKHSVIIFERQLTAEENEKNLLALERFKEVRAWMEQELSLTSLEAFVAGTVSWLRCNHPLHNPLRSILTKARLSREKSGSDGAVPSVTQETNEVHVIDSKENSGTPGVFQTLALSPDAVTEIQKKGIKDILQLGSINYFSTVQLIKHLDELGIANPNLSLIDICATVPEHLLYLFQRGRLKIKEFKSYQMDALHLTFPENSFDMVYEDMVGPYVEDIDRLYAQAFKVLRPGGVFVPRERFYENHDEYVAKRNETTPVEPLIDFLFGVFPAEENLEMYIKIKEFIIDQANTEWDFKAFWDRPLSRYLESAIKAGFQIKFKPVFVDPDGTGQRKSMTILLIKPE